MRFQSSYWTITKSLIKKNDFIFHHPILKNMFLEFKEAIKGIETADKKKRKEKKGEIIIEHKHTFPFNKIVPFP